MEIEHCSKGLYGINSQPFPSFIIERDRERSAYLNIPHIIPELWLWLHPDVDTRKRDLERVFEKYGRLREIWMARNPPCFAFVVYAHQKDADRALKETDGM